MPAGRSDMCLLDLGLTSNQVWGLIRTDEARTGLHRIGSDVVNTYLVEDASGVMIVDAALPGHWRELNQELRQLSYSLDHVGGIVLTHGDTDDIGFAERFRQRNGVLVHVHELDAAWARGQIGKPHSGWGPIMVRPLLGFLWYSARHGGSEYRRSARP